MMVRSGVYRITCGHCTASYIGETGCKLSTKIEKHINSYRNKIQNKSSKFSAIADHCVTSHHPIEDISVSLLHDIHPPKKRLAVENIEIIKHLNSTSYDVINNYIPNNSLIDLVYA